MPDATAQMTGASLTIRNLGLSIDPARIPAARARLQGAGVSEWARRHGFTEKLVHAVLSGTRPCTRGKSHDIAIALGLKDTPAS
ncbi:MAG: hypothetical protein RL490_1451 [Pseudomonadota bacterium]